MGTKKPFVRKLDNTAKIFPISTSKRDSTVFRLYALLKEDVKPDILEKAVIQALERYKSFRVKMKPGFFWYYFEYNEKLPIIEVENGYPCEYIDAKKNNGYLFKVTYTKNRINIDIFHSLTDGSSGTTFFKEIIYSYIELAHPEELKEELRTVRKIDYNTEDSYLKNYDKKAKSNASGKRAYKIKGKRLKPGLRNVTHEVMNLEQVKRECKKHNMSVTQYLTAVLIYAIYKENYIKSNGTKPIKVCIPVDLRRYFPSKTLSNFFSYLTVEAEAKKDNLDTFEKIIEFVKKEFEKRLTKEEIVKTMSTNVKLGINPIIRVIPLFLKRIIVRISYLEIRRYTTTTYSNIGRIGIIGKYQDYLDNFALLIAPGQFEKMKCSSCIFENKMVFTFTTILEEKNIEKRFHEILIENGIESEMKE